jgi:hypothetical protein
MTWIAENASNIGFWILVGIVVWPLSLLGGAILTRKRYRRALEIAETVLSDPEANQSDRRWLEHELADVIDWRTAPALSFLAPAFPAMAIFAAFDMHRSLGPVSVAEMREEREDLDRRMDRLQMAIAELRGYPDPTKGKYWDHPFNHEFNDLSVTISFLRNPALTAWIAIWAVMALPFLLIGGVIPLSRHIFREMVQPVVIRTRMALNMLSVA